MKSSKRAAREALQLFRACLVNGALDTGRVRGVVDQLADAKPRGYLETLVAFRRLVRLECARHTASIESAQALPADVETRVLESLFQAYGTVLDASFTKNPALLGGVRIQVGSDVYEGSVRGRLAALERTF